MLQAVGEVDGATSGRRIFDRLRVGKRYKPARSAGHHPCTFLKRFLECTTSLVARSEAKRNRARLAGDGPEAA